MPDPEDIVELSTSPGSPPAPTPPPAAGAGRPFLRLWFTCAGRYARAYRAGQEPAYTARCPACGAPVRIPIGPGGTSDRSFVVRCP